MGEDIKEGKVIMQSKSLGHRMVELIEAFK